MNDAPGHGAAGAAPDWDAIARYLAGESSAAEAARVGEWLETHPADRALVERLRQPTLDLSSEPIDVEAALENVHARMRDNVVALPARTARRPAWRTYVFAPLAAAAVIAAVVLLQRTRAAAPAPAAMTYATAVGQRDSVRLADGSRVILGPASRLVVPAGYGTSTRTVELTGDGYFQIRHNTNTPFAVRVGHAYVEDVGTVFSVESDAGDTTNVSVLEGSVRLRGTGSTSGGIVLKAGDRGAVAGAGPATLDQGRATPDDAAWASGRLVFRDASLLRVAGELRRWYGVRLIFADSSLTDRRLTASFQGESAEQVLRTIGLTLGVSMSLQGDSAIVSTIQESPVSR